ncbi:hypothetical protein BS47DRAFT_522612 [Hydnum rufescens UP504]|uniref:Uncharacterized protein n=1 Tax=Hydnum rufescens UP504 TaxID=1448309 RepID=A0A9P6B419_9AGAM|nr:hypothetical protein BS47DRAFT_522612 [Hydnum rufescens UP504]
MYERCFGDPRSLVKGCLFRPQPWVRAGYMRRLIHLCDPSTSGVNSIRLHVNRMAQEISTAVLTSMHQSNSETFSLFDNVLFLGCLDLDPSCDFVINIISRSRGKSPGP